MTPDQLREKAKSNLKSARTLLAGDPDNASYLAGYAIELTLKARLCTKRGWDRLPDKKEFREWCERDGFDAKDRIFIHDLQTLLTLSDTEYLKRSGFTHIDWEAACNWSEQERYQPTGTADRSDIENKINETEKAVDQLLAYELVEALLKIEIETSTEFGPYTCFSVNQHKDGIGWVLVCSWHSVTQKHSQDRIDRLEELLENRLEPTIAELLVDKHWLPPDAPIIEGIVMLTALLGPWCHSPTVTASENLVVGYPTPTPGYYITVGRWAEESLRIEWERAGILMLNKDAAETLN